MTYGVRAQAEPGPGRKRRLSGGLAGLLMARPARGRLAGPSVRNLAGTSDVYEGHMVV
jgi:hypothetical protein